MKKIYLYVAFALASIGMISCTDILDQDPLDSFTDEAVWNDLALSETYLNAQYMNLMAENMKGTRCTLYRRSFSKTYLWFRKCDPRIIKL